jgi:hypothetical protein
MDERRKTIKELEKKKYENLDSLALILRELGETLLARLDRREVPAGPPRVPGELFKDNLGEYRRLSREIAASEDDMAAVNADAVRLKEAEERISRKEAENAEKAKNLLHLYTRAGESLLEEGDISGPAAAYRRQAEELIPKIKSLEDRLAELEETDGLNVITWIGKSAKSLVLRSLLGKSQNNLLRIYAAAGKQWALSDPQEPPDNRELHGLCKEIRESREFISALEAELAILKDERKRINDSFGPEGHPAKRIQVLEKQAVQLKEELASVCRRFGGYAAEKEGEFAPVLEEEDRALLEKARMFRESAGEYEAHIEKLKASLAIDGERAEIKKMEQVITNHRRRIAASENTIAELNRHIAEANQHIQELRKI